MPLLTNQCCCGSSSSGSSSSSSSSSSQVFVPCFSYHIRVLSYWAAEAPPFTPPPLNDPISCGEQDSFWGLIINPFCVPSATFRGVFAPGGRSGDRFCIFEACCCPDEATYPCHTADNSHPGFFDSSPYIIEDVDSSDQSGQWWEANPSPNCSRQTTCWGCSDHSTQFPCNEAPNTGGGFVF